MNANNRVICSVCRDRVTYHIHTINKKTNINGRPIEYKEARAFCDICGNEVWVAELDDINAIAPINAYIKEIERNACE